MRIVITDEIELQLKTGAYGISQTLKLRTLKEEMDYDIYERAQTVDNSADVLMKEVGVFKTE